MEKPPLDLPAILRLTNQQARACGDSITLRWDGSAWVGRAIIIRRPSHPDELRIME